MDNCRGRRVEESKEFWLTVTTKAKCCVLQIISCQDKCPSPTQCEGIFISGRSVQSYPAKSRVAESLASLKDLSFFVFNSNNYKNDNELS